MKYYEIIENIQKFQRELNFQFENIEYILRALTHSSFANEHKELMLKSNERFEFLGDSILSIIVSEYIFKNYVDLPEGELTRIRAVSVCESSLAECSKKLNVGKYMLLGKGEELSGGRERSSILSDCFEAILAGIYLDKGLEKAKEFTLNQLKDTIDSAAKGKILKDYKTHLQEHYQKVSKNNVKYITVKEDGPDHDKIFFVEVMYNGDIIGKGSGKTKKEAEQNAAKEACDKLGEV